MGRPRWWAVECGGTASRGNWHRSTTCQGVVCHQGWVIVGSYLHCVGAAASAGGARWAKSRASDMAVSMLFMVLIFSSHGVKVGHQLVWPKAALDARNGNLLAAKARDEATLTGEEVERGLLCQRGWKCLMGPGGEESPPQKATMVASEWQLFTGNWFQWPHRKFCNQVSNLGKVLPGMRASPGMMPPRAKNDWNRFATKQHPGISSTWVMLAAGRKFLSSLLISKLFY